MKRRIRKYILFSCMLAMTIACLTSTTYAFVLINQSVEIEAFDLQINTGNGMLISYDGVRFYNAIPAQDLEEYIAGLENNATFEFSKMNLAPVTMKQEAQKISYTQVDDSNTTLPKSQFINMEKDSVVYDHTQAYDYDSVFSSHHEMISATKNVDYLTFDLYFKLDGNYDKTKTYKVELSGNQDRTNSFIRNVKGSDTVTLQNDLTSGADVYGPTHEGKKTITVDAKDAMRMAFVHNNGASNDVVIVEDNVGLGSAAIKGKTDNAHNPECNAMWTYYNNLWTPGFGELAAEDGEAYNEENYTTLGTNRELGTFTFDEAGNCNILKVTVTIWLEGWDADYFLDVDHGLSQFKIRLKFDLKNPE